MAPVPLKLVTDRPRDFGPVQKPERDTHLKPDKTGAQLFTNRSHFFLAFGESAGTYNASVGRGTALRRVPFLMYDQGSGRPPEVLAAADRLVPALWEDLRRVARRERRRVGAGHTLQTTALVSETWLKLRRKENFLDDQHFLRAAAIAMRSVLIDHARARLAAKRGSGKIDPLTDDIEPFWESDERLVELDEALTRLSKLNPRLAEVVELRFFGGYTEVQAADILGVTDRTIRRDWIKARAWLYRELSGVPIEPHAPDQSDPATPE